MPQSNENSDWKIVSQSVCECVCGGFKLTRLFYANVFRVNTTAHGTPTGKQTNKRNEKFNITTNHTHSQNVNSEICIFPAVNGRAVRIGGEPVHPYSFSIYISFVLFLHRKQVTWRSVKKDKNALRLANLRKEACCNTKTLLKLYWKKRKIQIGATQLNVGRC